VLPSILGFGGSFGGGSGATFAQRVAARSGIEWMVTTLRFFADMSLSFFLCGLSAARRNRKQPVCRRRKNSELVENMREPFLRDLSPAYPIG
jgi:hypothetical protein